MFIISPRELDAVDRENLTVVSSNTGTGEVSLPDVEHLGLQLGDTVERWKVFNTARATNREFGVWESERTYPELLGCNDEFFWGELTYEKVRYHVFPTRDKGHAHVTERELTNFGIVFDNVQYPDSDIVGHYFVRVKKEEGQAIVHGTGYIVKSNVFTDEDLTIVGIADKPATGTTKYWSLWNPEIVTGKQIHR